MTTPISSLDENGANYIFSQLLEGNRRFARGESEHHEKDAEMRTILLNSGQHPRAAVLACSDSRVPPEILFDQGLGDIFTVRTAGCALGPAVIESLEYAVSHLGVKVLLILTHEDCGAVKAAMEGGHEDELPYIMGELQNSVELAREAELEDTADVERIHVARIIERLVEDSEVIRTHIADDSLYVAGVRYSMQTGRVEVLSF